ncbi:MAG: hypothetical protein WBE92_15555 [Steroidobacteraceae bacterium]
MSAPDSIDADSPWLGLASFTEQTRALFFGREQEVAELERRVQRKLLGPAGHGTEVSISAVRAVSAANMAYERDDFATAGRIARDAVAQLQAARHSVAPQNRNYVWSILQEALFAIEGHAEYHLGDFAAAAQAERMALQAVSADASNYAQRTTWLSMALAREGKRTEAAQTIAPVVTMYRALEKRNHGDQWVPLEFAAALYAQALTDPSHRASLLREAAERVDHLIPAIARLHDTREWRARIEAAQRAPDGQAAQ